MTGLGYSLTRIAVFYVPMVWIASRIDGSATVYAAIAAANGLGGIAIAWHSLSWLKKAEERGLDEPGDGAGGDVTPQDERPGVASPTEARTDPASC